MRAFIPAVPLDPQQYQPWCFRLAFVIYALILALGSIPGLRSDVGAYASGLELHSLAYSGLASLLFIGRSGTAARRGVRAVWMVAMMGAGDELVQGLFPYRHAAVSDWLVDCAAAAVTALLLAAAWPRLTGGRRR